MSGLTARRSRRSRSAPETTAADHDPLADIAGGGRRPPAEPASSRADELLPPGPTTPAAGQALEWFRRPVEWMERQRRNHGPVFRARLGPLKRVAFVGEPQAVREILKADPETVRMGDANGMMRPVVGSGSILLLDGEQHLAHRRLMLPSFHGDHVRSYTELIKDAAERRVSSWQLDRPLRLEPEMEEISFSTILAMVIGRDAGLSEARIRSLFPSLMDLCGSPLTLMPTFRHEIGGLSPYGKLMSVVKELDEALYAEIDLRRRDPDLSAREDLLSVLAQATHPDGRPLSDQELRDETVTLLMAGWETTTSALAWAFERLARHPEVADRLAGSLAAGEKDYLDAVVKETLRQRPVIPALARKLSAPMDVGEFRFPAGWVLMPSVHLVHHDPSIYPDPHVFRPERFLNGPPPRAVWIPFGGGVRRCLGASLAELEMRTVIAAVVPRLELSATESGSEPARRARFTLTPGNGATVIAKRRRLRPLVGGRSTQREASPDPAPQLSSAA